jgi:NTE family protein
MTSAPPAPADSGVDVGSGLSADLVLEGGGVLGIAHVGALEVLDAAGYGFQRVAGTSVGALVGALVAAGMPVPRMTELIRDLDFRRFTDKSLVDRIPVAGPLASIALENGVYEGDEVRDWVAQQLAELGVETFGDLRRDDPGDAWLPVERRYRLVVTAADLTRGELVRFPWDYQRVYGLDPDEQSVADAVRASTSIPFFYEPATITAADGTRSTLVDGGVLANFPIDLLDRTDGERPRWPTFGVKLLPRLPVDAERLVPGLGLLARGPVQLLSDLVMTTIVGRDQAYLDLPWVRVRTMQVDTGNVSPVDFGVDDAEKDLLLAAGRAAAEDLLGRWDWDGYVDTYRS